MHILMFLVVFMICYIHNFKDSFRTEAIEKVTPVLVVLGIVVVLFSVLTCLIR